MNYLRTKLTDIISLQESHPSNCVFSAISVCQDVRSRQVMDYIPDNTLQYAWSDEAIYCNDSSQAFVKCDFFKADGMAHLCNFWKI